MLNEKITWFLTSLTFEVALSFYFHFYWRDSVTNSLFYRELNSKYELSELSLVENWKSGFYFLGAFYFSTFWANWQHVSIFTIFVCTVWSYKLVSHSLSAVMVSFYLILVALPCLHFLLIIKRFERFDEANSGLMLIVFKSFDVSMNAVLLSQKNEFT